MRKPRDQKPGQDAYCNPWYCDKKMIINTSEVLILSIERHEKEKQPGQGIKYQGKHQKQNDRPGIVTPDL